MREGSSDEPRETSTDLQAFAVRLRRLNGEFNRLAHAFAQTHGLHPTDIHALGAILDAERGDPLTPSRLRERLDLTSGAVTACLDRLERAGHIARVRDQSDRRVVHLHYQPAARDLARRSFAPLARGTDVARQQFSDEQLATVARFLDTLNEQLEDER
ncbi:MarR family transcriptional regulator [Streptomyces sp. NPDC052225]|uniref:MarR family winged helix-turn-helix transcriptional regulator n=1 Tax=Streptomyces sp. NPDC052225 TaxID=3154949 RepID=UPI00343ED7B2